VNVTWYYTPGELFAEMHEFFGSAELLISDHSQDIPVSSIIQKIELLPFEEYYSRDVVEAFVFFFRGHYNHSTGAVTPEFGKWRRTCLCDSIINPDTPYLLCDGCDGLFHEACVKKSAEEFTLCEK
jgi:hypothetical protein